jgi:hypothetical protein
VTEPERPLRGGTLNTVVRVGDTVRRPSGPWTAGVHDLLRHIRRRGFDLAPRPLGLDDRGREVLSYIPGDTAGWALPWPEWIRSDDMLVQVADALRRYHRAVADFRPTGAAGWRSGGPELGPGEIICHHDVAPYNVVVTGGRLVGIIDWDLAGPGRPRSDLAFAAWQWVPFHGPFVSSLMGWPAEGRARRLEMFLDAYGLQDRSGFVGDVEARIEYNRAVMLARAAEGDAAYQSLVDQGHVAGMDEALAYVRAL